MMFPLDTHGLIIGVGGDLPHMCDDARGLATVLTDPMRCALPTGRVTVLTEHDTARAQVLAALDALSHAATPESTVIIYFAGTAIRKSVDRRKEAHSGVKLEL